MTVRIELEQDPIVRVSAEQGDTILASLLRAGVDFPHDCQAGNCGTCKCELVSGEITELPYSEFALDTEERARDLILACRSQVWSDCVVRPLEQDDQAVHPARIMNCSAVDMQPLTHNIQALKLEIKSGGPYTFSAGQYAQVEFAPGLSGYFSMANRPVDPILEFHVRREPNKGATEYVHSQLRLGHSVKVSGPAGLAYLRGNHQGPILAIAGGSALAPLRSIIEMALLVDPARAITLYFGVRTEQDVFDEARLQRLAGKHANFRYHIVLSEEAHAGRRSGLVSAALAQDRPVLANAKAYVAGPVAMVEMVAEQLRQAGLSERDLHSDGLQTTKAGA
jgi:naphthalene 1,2-dioxygenase ferredoxin reductase component